MVQEASAASGRSEAEPAVKRPETSGTLRRDFRFGRVFNFRDLGGYPTRTGQSVRWRRLFRSDSLSGLGEEDRETFRSLGVRTVVDLRRGYEIERYGRCPEWDGLAYCNIDPGHREWDENPYTEGDPAHYLADRYRDMAEEGAPRFAEALGLIADERAAPVVVHCVAGKDRTGVLCALTLSVLGVSDEDIDADYAKSTVGNQRYVAWANANGQPEIIMEPWYYSPPGTMHLFLSELRQRHGSVESYLAGAGVGPDLLGTLRAHLLD